MTAIVLDQVDEKKRRFLIVATTAAAYGHDGIFQLIQQYILPAVQDAP